MSFEIDPHRQDIDLTWEKKKKRPRAKKRATGQDWRPSRFLPRAKMPITNRTFHRVGEPLALADSCLFALFSGGLGSGLLWKSDSKTEFSYLILHFSSVFLCNPPHPLLSFLPPSIEKAFVYFDGQSCRCVEEVVSLLASLLTQDYPKRRQNSALRDTTRPPDLSLLVPPELGEPPNIQCPKKAGQVAGNLWDPPNSSGQKAQPRC